MSTILPLLVIIALLALAISIERKSRASDRLAAEMARHRETIGGMEVRADQRHAQLILRLRDLADVVADAAKSEAA